MSPGYPALRQVDVHTHALPQPLLQWLAEQGLAEPDDVPREAYDVEARLAFMDEAGVEVHAVSVSPHLRTPASPDAGFVRELARRSNEALAGFVAQAPDRLVALAAVPVGLADATEEVRRCLDDLGMAGVVLATRGLGRDLTDPVHTPLWELLVQHRAFTLLHPVAAPGQAGTLAAAVDLATGVAALLHAGVLETYDVPLCLAYGGGALPSVRGLLQRGWERLGEGPALRHSPLDQLRRLFYDTATFDPLQLQQLVEFAGPAQVLMGSDYPAPLGDADPIGVVEACQFGPVQEMITGVTATSLLRLTV
ncbi:amidohydrolase family protein [Raineyella sp. W15-4]|uniref:amidohydrolase family protein n=1 Tax=Raineyella sp. W15-4 TaxID=3081651 RepID=UPI0029553B89|nr:amidohydrolase family protein [Raineyella sp. W15-4]WOQ17441.1 amidohydrolase family protein [Raineyella sp. W15-4]